MVDTVESSTQTVPAIYDEIGVRPIINGRGATTAVGGTLMSPEVLAAMTEAAGAFVVLDDLNRRVGERIATLTGMEAGYVTSGSAAGMVLAAAACIAGTDPERIKALPESNGLANEFVIHRAHRINYDQMLRVAGGRLVEIGTPEQTKPRELEQAITDANGRSLLCRLAAHQSRCARLLDRGQHRARSRRAGHRRRRVNRAPGRSPSPLGPHGAPIWSYSVAAKDSAVLRILGSSPGAPTSSTRREPTVILTLVSGGA